MIAVLVLLLLGLVEPTTHYLHRRTQVNRTCVECDDPTPNGHTYCSTRCRNADDRHDAQDGDL